MSSLNIYDFTIPQFIHSLNALSKFLTKGVETAPSKGLDSSKFPTASLAPDMKPLPFQVTIATAMTKKLVVDVTGASDVELPKAETFDEMHARIQAAVKFLEGVKREDFEGKEDKEVDFFGRKLKALDFTNRVIVPNFYFHITTAYAILRNQGIDVGKMDYLGI